MGNRTLMRIIHHNPPYKLTNKKATPLLMLLFESMKKEVYISPTTPSVTLII